MGAKQSTSTQTSTFSLNPNERRRLTVFLESKGSHSKFNRQHMQELWKDLLVPDLLNCYAEFLMKQDTAKKSFISIDEFVFIYSALIRGDPGDKVNVFSSMLGPPRKNASGDVVISFTTFCKYLSDLLESYFLGLKHRNDNNYKSWTHLKQPERLVIEEVTRGICADLPRNNDDIAAYDLESWVNMAGVITLLHSYVLGSMYNLEPELKATIIPLAVLPTTKTPTFLDLSHIVYLNSFLPSEEKVQWRLLFSTMSHGESFSKLVGCMTNQGPIIMVIESDDRSMFGGFISVNIAPGPKWVGSEDSFLFKLKPTVEVYPSTGYNDHYVYLNLNQQSLPNGLGMGGQHSYWGLWLDSHFGIGECSESCTTFKNYTMLATKKKFKIIKLEIWGVGKPPPTAAERGERTTGATSILDKDATASSMLAMAGRKTYSDGLREGSPPKH